jgi:hypothetical protein
VAPALPALVRKAAEQSGRLLIGAEASASWTSSLSSRIAQIRNRQRAYRRLQMQEEPEDVEAIVALVRENHELDAELAAELCKAEARLHSGLALADVLGQHDLRMRSMARPEG